MNMNMKKNWYPLNYTEHIGRCIIRKVREYGYKYRVTYGPCSKQFATIQKARDFAFSDLQTINATPYATFD